MIHIVFLIHLKFSLIKVQQAAFQDIAITSVVVLKDAARYELWNQLELQFSLRKNESPKIEHWYHIKEKADLPINPN